MARKITKAAYLREIDRLTPQMRAVYLAWVQERIDGTSISSVERWVRTANVDAIVRELGVTPASLTNVLEQLRTTYVAGGQLESGAFPASARFTFDVRNVAAERWLAQESSSFVTRIVGSQRESVREALETGARNGRNPRSTALSITGRIDSTGTRRGGIVGLNGPQTNAAGRAWEELRSGDPTQLRSYLSRERRDRRFDSIVLRSLREGQPLPAARADQIAGRYADRLLQLRGETIARTETIHAFNAAREQAWEQAIEEGIVRRQYISARWSATPGSRTRDSHREMNNQEQPHGQPFRSPLGSLMRYPGDTGLGALAEDTINCRCFLEKSADFIAQEAAA